MHFGVVQGNIARQTAHALVSTTGPECRMNCGVSGELRSQAGGPVADDVSQEQPITEGDVIVTDAYDLPALYLLHSVPLSREGSASEESIRETTRTVLEKADELECRSLVLPLLGCGGGGYDLEAGIRYICEEILLFGPKTVADVRVIGHTERDYETLLEIARNVKSPNKSFEDAH